MPRSEWEITPGLPGTFDLRLNRRPVKYDLDDLDEAFEEARNRGATEVTVIEGDGYRTKHRLAPEPPPPQIIRDGDPYGADNPYLAGNPYGRDTP